MKEKVVLAYSGGLDTTAVIPWLKENYDYDVVCCCVNVGQGNEIDGLQERAKLSGAEKLYILLQRSLLRLQEKKELLLYVMVLQEREMIRFVLSWHLRHLLLI